MKRIVFSTLIAATLATGSAQIAAADTRDALAGALVGGLIVHGIHEHNRSHAPRAVAPRAPAAPRYYAPSAEQIAMQETQTALNYFQFNVGYADGIAGRQTRSGMAMYQSYLGFPATGVLSGFERQVLMTAYQRAILGGPQVLQISASHPYGVRGLLNQVLNEALYPNGAPGTQPAGYGAPQEATNPAVTY